MSTISIVSSLYPNNDFELSTSWEQFLDSEDMISIISNHRFFSKLSIYFDINKIKQWIDYALKPPIVSPVTDFNIELININKHKLNNQEEIQFNRGYKYPYLASEILSNSYPFIIDKIIPTSVATNQNNSFFIGCCDTILVETSITNNSVNDDNLNNNISDDIEETTPNPVTTGSNVIQSRKDNMSNTNLLWFNPPEIEYNTTEKDMSFNTSIDKKYFITPANMDNTSAFNVNLELIDYLFSLCSDISNDIQCSYFSKIIISFFHMGSVNKTVFFVSYICLKKKEILLNMMNNIQYNYNSQIILEILLFEHNLTLNNNNNNSYLNINNNLSNNDDMDIFDTIKSQIVKNWVNIYHNTFTMNKYNKDDVFSNIYDLITEYINAKTNCELFFNENFLNSYAYCYSLCNNNGLKFLTAMDYLIRINNEFIKEYKAEYDKNQKMCGSMSKSHLKCTEKLTDKTVILGWEIDNVVCGKFNSFFENIGKYFEMTLESNKNIILHIMEMWGNMMQLTRNNSLLTNLTKDNCIGNIVNCFFIFENDIFQTIFLNILKIIIIEDYNEQWVNTLFIKAKLLDGCFQRIKNTSYKKKYKFRHVHIAQIFEMILSNTQCVAFFQKWNWIENITKVYNESFWNYLEIMNTPLGNFKNNYLYISGFVNKTYNEITSVDELDVMNNNTENWTEQKNKKDIKLNIGSPIKNEYMYNSMHLKKFSSGFALENMLETNENDRIIGETDEEDFCKEEGEVDDDENNENKVILEKINNAEKELKK